MPRVSGRQHYADDDARWGALMASAQGGDERAYRQLLEEVSTVLERFLRSRIGAVGLVEDCVQETLIAVHKGRHSYDPQRSFRAWLFAIARYKAVDALRRTRPCEEAGEMTEHEAASPGDTMEGTLAGGQMLQALSTQHREAIVLTKLVGLSTSEAADRLAISESALKVRVHRGIRRLRQMLEAELL